MRGNLILLIFASIGLFSCEHIGTSKLGKVVTTIEAIDSTKFKEPKTQTNALNSFIDTEFTYSDSEGKDVTIQNSLPKGGGDIDGVRGYYDANGTHYGYGIFWTRIVNETTSALELTLNFPAPFFSIPEDSFSISASSTNYFKLFLPPTIMTVNNVTLYNYGITGLKSFLDTNFNMPSILQKTIGPNQEFMFVIVMLIKMPDQPGSIRTGIVLEEQNLFYSVNVNHFGTKLIPCGHFVLKKSKQ